MTQIGFFYRVLPVVPKGGDDANAQERGHFKRHQYPSGAATQCRLPRAARRCGLLLPEEAKERAQIGDDRDQRHQQQVGGVELDRNVEEEVEEHDIGHDERREHGAQQRGAAIEQQQRAEKLDAAADLLINLVHAQQRPEHGQRRGLSHGLIQYRQRRRRHLDGKDLP